MRSAISAAAAALVVLLAAAGGAVPAFAQDEGYSDEEMFGGGTGLVTETSEAAASGAGAASGIGAAGSLLKSETVKIGGAFYMTLEGTGDPDEWGSDPLRYLAPSAVLRTDLYADARPDEDFRVFVKGGLEYPEEGNADLKLKEAFADLVPVDGVFVRAGRQTANWGVGWFFSPANLLDLATVDPEDPEAELPGPLAIKVQVPTGADNYYAYALLDDAAEGGPAALAPKAEWVIGSAEVALGGIWSASDPWAAMATYSGAVGDLDLFAEAVLRGNGDKRFVVADASAPLGLSVETRADELYPQATFGFGWAWDEEEGRLGVSLRAQYYYNGLGYEDSSILSENSAKVGALLQSGALAPDDLVQRDRHYGAANLAFSDILGSDAGASLFWIGNLADASGRTKATVSWAGLDHVIPSVAWTWSYGRKGSEFAPAGAGSSVSLLITVTQGTF
ncbi:MAG: hypothetical protein A2Z99_21270 [Treponema sp. GWB1_62_6]|nr:MAG: hypothetical protein A2Y36_09035 [Treponema sp. GWA1_62_8]OHE68377.1 MAG: hypothetical protein A2001_06255 [Treponema sp. GWC1_61_84]OHE71266.1 MAG: hypothetical protein A2413_19615 [Treponema sp. RIFOXYC1_FULL_61_9]OHE71725.1 MAG: hypothetical protein A2Z99_21270 [Treponema sp. GWB1_62_6]HCM28779.1 hypothetical protein [Treponema sp.]